MMFFFEKEKTKNRETEDFTVIFFYFTIFLFACEFSQNLRELGVY